MEGGGLTQLGGLAQNEGVGPEFGDGGAVEAGVTHRLPEAAVCDYVQHVQSSPQCSDDAAEDTRMQTQALHTEPLYPVYVSIRKPHQASVSTLCSPEV